MSVTIGVTPRKTGTITNTAQVSSSSPDPDTANNSVSEQTVITR